MNDNVLGSIGAQVGSLGKQIGLSTIQAPGDIVKVAASQVGVSVPAEEKKDQEQSAEAPKTAEQKTAEDALGKQKAAEFTKLMYGASSFDEVNSDPNAIAALAQQGNAKTPEEQAKIASLQQQLQSQHASMYYEPTFNRQEPVEERAQEKVEREEEEKKISDLEIAKKEEKNQNISVIMASNKTEQFREQADNIN